LLEENARLKSELEKEKKDRFSESQEKEREKI
jgi:hypothetical protein